MGALGEQHLIDVFRTDISMISQHWIKEQRVYTNDTDAENTPFKSLHSLCYTMGDLCFLFTLWK
jgi:hypothetical protein